MNLHGSFLAPCCEKLFLIIPPSSPKKHEMEAFGRQGHFIIIANKKLQLVKLVSANLGEN